MWLLAKVTLWPLMSFLNLLASGIQHIIGMLLQYFGSHVIIQIGVYGGSVTAAVQRVASKSLEEHFSSGSLYLAMWLLRVLSMLATMSVVLGVQRIGTTLFGHASSTEIWVLSALMAFTTAGDMCALLSAASEALLTVATRDRPFLEKRYAAPIEPVQTRFPMDITDDVEDDSQENLLERVIHLLDDTKKADLVLLSDGEEEWEIMDRAQSLERSDTVKVLREATALRERHR